MLFTNVAFFRHVAEIYPLPGKNIAYVSSLAVFLIFIVIFLFTLLCFRYTTKSILIGVVLTSSLIAYFSVNVY